MCKMNSYEQGVEAVPEQTEDSMVEELCCVGLGKGCLFSAALFSTQGVLYHMGVPGSESQLQSSFQFPASTRSERQSVMALVLGPWHSVDTQLELLAQSWPS